MDTPEHHNRFVANLIEAVADYLQGEGESKRVVDRLRTRVRKLDPTRDVRRAEARERFLAMLDGSAPPGRHR